MNTLKQLALFSLALLMSTVSALAFQKETRDVSEFTKISLRTSIDVYVKQGSTQKVELQGDKDEIEKVVTEVKGDKLVIKDIRENNWRNWSGPRGVKVFVTVKDVKALSVAGSGDMMSESKFKCEDLDVAVSGSGNLEFEADAKDVYASISGSGSIRLTGSSEENDVSISGSGKLDAEDLVADTYKITISGSGRARVHAKEEIRSRISGSGSIYYKGEPKRVDNNSSGSGKIRKI